MTTNKSVSFMVDEYPIETFIPHSPPMVLLDKIVQYSKESLTAEITIHTGSKFYDKNIEGVATWVGLEYISQAIAALAGIHATIENRKIKLGFLLGTRKYHIHQKIFRKNIIYSISIVQLFKDNSGFASFDCKITERATGSEQHSSEILCVQSRLNVFETNDIDQLK